jgi:uncharacterized membrane protein YphA (DoxX/SURF4 family)
MMRPLTPTRAAARRRAASSQPEDDRVGALAALATRPVVAAMLAACIALSPRLWGTRREFPPVPLLDVPDVTGGLPAAVVVAALAALLALAVVTSRWTPWPFLAAAAVLVVGDLTRLQPWLYQGALCLAAFALCRRPLDACRLVLVATYAWSGVSKLNPDFGPTVLPWLVPPAAGLGPAVLWWLGIATGLVEAAIGIALCFPRIRRVAAVAALATHAMVLVAIGPTGRDWNRVVWPWNLAMCALVVLLFWSERRPAGAILWSREWYPRALLALVGVLPAMNLAGAWDAYLSFSLYSGNIDEAWLVVEPAAVATAPASARAVGERRPDGTLVAWFVPWAVRDVGVPPYPERRGYLVAFRALCRDAPDPRALRLIVRQRWPLTHARPEPETRGCDAR